MAISTKDVAYIASLAKLRLNENEIPLLTEQLNRILEYVEQLNELDTSQVEPLAHPLELNNVFREDLPQPSLTQNQALQNAPKRAGDYFSVPKVVRK